jgi:hypothetical protein
MARPIRPETHGHAYFNDLLISASRLKVSAQVTTDWSSELQQQTIDAAVALETVCMAHKQRLNASGVTEVFIGRNAKKKRRVSVRRSSKKDESP